jgi:hypothetical protein
MYNISLVGHVRKMNLLKTWYGRMYTTVSVSELFFEINNFLG